MVAHLKMQISSLTRLNERACLKPAFPITFLGRVQAKKKNKKMDGFGNKSCISVTYVLTCTCYYSRLPLAHRHLVAVFN